MNKKIILISILIGFLSTLLIYRQLVYIVIQLGWFIHIILLLSILLLIISLLIGIIKKIINMKSKLLTFIRLSFSKVWGYVCIFTIITTSPVFLLSLILYLTTFVLSDDINYVPKKIDNSYFSSIEYTNVTPVEIFDFKIELPVKGISSVDTTKREDMVIIELLNDSGYIVILDIAEYNYSDIINDTLDSRNVDIPNYFLSNMMELLNKSYYEVQKTIIKTSPKDIKLGMTIEEFSDILLRLIFKYVHSSADGIVELSYEDNDISGFIYNNYKFTFYIDDNIYMVTSKSELELKEIIYIINSIKGLNN